MTEEDPELARAVDDALQPLANAAQLAESLDAQAYFALEVLGFFRQVDGTLRDFVGTVDDVLGDTGAEVSLSPTTRELLGAARLSLEAARVEIEANLRDWTILHDHELAQLRAAADAALDSGEADRADAAGPGSGEQPGTAPPAASGGDASDGGGSSNSSP